MLKPGDHIYIYRYSPIIYTHHGIVMSVDRSGIQVAHPIKQNNTAIYCITDLKQFIGDPMYCAPFDVYNSDNLDALKLLIHTIAYKPLEIINVKKYSKRLQPKQIIKNALNFINEKKEYCLLTNNCEMFAEYCSTGVRPIVSHQLINNINRYATGNDIVHNMNIFIIDSLSDMLGFK